MTKGPADRPTCFAAAAPGLEQLTALELKSLGIGPVRVEEGGVSFPGGPEQVFRANLWLRTANRVLIRIADFHAEAFYELERHAKKIAFERFLGPGQPVQLSVACHKSRLYHSGAVAERVLAAIEKRVPKLGKAEVASREDDGEADEGPGPQRFVVRFFRDHCTVSVDTSGESLHRRGYRQAVAKAPLRETIAAAMLLACRWHGDRPLLDPMCGSGTIAIEAAQLARRIAPGLHRGFAFERWPDFDSNLFKRVRDDALGRALPSSPVPLMASDHIRGAIEAARGNAERAGVTADVQLDVRELGEIAPPAGKGLLLTNAPFGVRVSERDALHALYSRLGEVARSKCPGWTLGVLLADPRLEKALGVPVRELLETRSGGIRVRLVSGAVPETPAP